jgi:hypothetical protein
MWPKIKNWIKDILALSEKDLNTIWQNTKVFVIPLVALGIVIKFRDILISLLVNSGKRIYQNTQQKNNKLQNQENQANQKANDLIQESDSLPEEKTKTEEDWYENE